jgi:Transposase protein/Winged helix-turn helix
MLQIPIRLLPKGAKSINDHIAIFHDQGELIFMNASCVIFKCSDNDQYGIRLAQGVLCSSRAVKPAQLARALGVNRSTVCRNMAAYERGGAQALLIEKSSNRGGYRLDAKNCKRAQKLLDQAVPLTKIGEAVGVSEGCIRYAIQKGALIRKRVVKEQDTAKYKSASRRCVEDCQSLTGVGVKREAERALASTGKLIEAAPVFSANESVRYAGILLALPVLAQLGFLDAAKKVYSRLRNGFYGLQSTLLTLAFMAFLRIKTPEQLKEKSPGELGIVLGLDRVPEAKTLRRKLKELGLYCKSAEYMAELTRRWCDDNQEAIGFVYIDGHVRPYHGRKHKLPKTHVARRRLCMPATTDFWVNDEGSEPLFLVTAEANDSLLSMLNSQVIPQIKALAGGRRVTLIFDREGWSPNMFAHWYAQGVDVITYRKGKYDLWPPECFIETIVGDQPVIYRLGERSVKIGKDFWMREVRRLCESGHQTSVMTTRQDLAAERIAGRMFSRWSQENFFRYMRHEYSLDHLLTYAVEAADGDRLAPCPLYKQKRDEIARMKAELGKMQEEYGQLAFENKESQRPSMRGFNIANAGCKNKIRLLKEQIEKAKMDLKQMPQKASLKSIVKDHEMVRLEKERKYLSDIVKMTCYRCETSLLGLLSPCFARAREEGRSFLKSLFQLPADILPDERAQTLTIKFHSMANPRSNRALKELCEIMTAEAFCFPQTALKMVFEAPNVASEIAGGQEL